MVYSESECIKKGQKYPFNGLNVCGAYMARARGERASKKEKGRIMNWESKKSRN
jgi:hypothetical protein